MSLRPSSVVVPCSTSNLGAGFDTVGLALSLHLRARFEPGGEALTVERSGTLAGLAIPVADDLLAASFVEVLEAHGKAPSGTLSVDSRVPLARGLGSSAAARVAGYALGRAALGLHVGAHDAFRVAAAGEGHGDNAAPCALGGLRAVVPAGDGLRALELPLSPGVGFAYAAPGHRVSTEAARGALPEAVPHAEAAAGLGRLVALLRGLGEADAELVRVAMDDALHVPYRLPLIPRGSAAVAAGYAAGAWGVTVSGSGSGLVAVCDPEAAAGVAGAMADALLGAEGPDPGAFASALVPDPDGLQVGEGAAPA